VFDAGRILEAEPGLVPLIVDVLQHPPAGRALAGTEPHAEPGEFSLHHVRLGDDQVTSGAAPQGGLARGAQGVQLGDDAAAEADPERVGRGPAQAGRHPGISRASAEQRRLGVKRLLDEVIEIARCCHVGRHAEEHVAQRARPALLAPNPAVEERRDGGHAVIDRSHPFAAGLDGGALAGLLLQVELAQAEAVAVQQLRHLRCRR